MSTDEKHRQYWRTNIKVLSILLAIWFVFACVLPIFLVEPLNETRIAGFKLGFWIAQQGSIIVFIFLVLAYAIIMTKVDAAYTVDDAVSAAESNGASNESDTKATEDTQP
ncbi:MAG: putative solute:sodium symporter small subunit [Candidatus Binatia bacterium]|jgi:putative solute:sodium symporter small subunit